ncbi:MULTISPECIES: GIY-YIG nuclease family protein [Yersinia]|uniref:GIY-YIG catalytic domain n=3 Tax=Yersinia ruckeri TaxID=29486 RepID=A0A380QQI5_YERRU|nr:MULTISPECIES: GIY-YIG nuclease family protein [Yersinia]AYW95468.1 GIY-YIG nuclease family protein [Yersinia pseudotuberculosis]EEP97545.1 hypothetical protein yruck0001_34030 [Yersinia ruckeri ATCC 29473]EKN4695552.1 GIY-YIG nuclease family protein [Yersinia ruckeri]KGA44210.1 GIY-YIG catalytic domain protein [Yersinia ruckeri ATCC 29473]MCK8565930.1 GIY-YIG nuclease family protein [Yersinia ruckeri]
MGKSIAKDEIYYIYVLRLEGGSWYVGSTKRFENRMRSHFGQGGSIATKQRKAIAIDKVFEIRDYQIQSFCAHEKAEILVAIHYANQFGAENIRGAKHGKGWDDKPTEGNLRDIKKCSQFALTSDGKILISALKVVDHRDILIKTHRVVN